MNNKFIKHGNSTIKLSAITGVSWKPAWTSYGSTYTKQKGRYVSIGNKSYRAKVTIRVGESETVDYYDSNELAEENCDAIVTLWESA